jgi:AraC-like DNA-binding protein
MRLTRARELLASGKPAAEVATEVGFFDQSHFIRHCKRRLGKTPKQLTSIPSCRTGTCSFGPLETVNATL